MVTDVNKPYCGDNFAVHTISKYYVVHLKLIWCDMSIVLLRSREKIGKVIANLHTIT